MLNIIPGPDSLYIIGRSASQGFRSGSTAACGIASGTLVHIFAAAFGLSAILATSAMAFTIIKILGCVYLIYMGISMLLSKAGLAVKSSELNQAPLKKVFYQGFITNVLNPKVALFFLAFVPQFIAHDAPNKALSFIVLGLIFNINGMLWCHFLAWSSSSLSRKVKQSTKVSNALNRLAGGLFICFGIKLAFSEQV
ncbi:LysE family translocator [Shewanella eurypsychrophilus]|uniref:LysE family translocator n=1 Tax=Shewanella eurypsychrophilus TaxID=2593656 RepID=A0ABX6VES4_9GAMM|nr:MULTISPECIES: LysE family translocator [Shewanella]QFU25179.1 LysE family translocator [Shewanella sp. YLB-09]QPG60329.1 LysE family translocator [Shewanella eurypsychrophilus]